MAEENTCFFDICLPNYTADSLRRITYFKDLTKEVPNGQERLAKCPLQDFKLSEFADSILEMSSEQVGDLRCLAYDSTPPKLPVNFEITELPYDGDMQLSGEMSKLMPNWSKRQDDDRLTLN